MVFLKIPLKIVQASFLPHFSNPSFIIILPFDAMQPKQLEGSINRLNPLQFVLRKVPDRERHINIGLLLTSHNVASSTA